MELFFLKRLPGLRRKRQDDERLPQPKNEPLVTHPVDTSYCQCGCATLLCIHCGCIYCPCCHTLIAKV